jgi:DNA-binding transcriptional MerR regulator/methylmalonyl-CoA mutase cobalamin-binding subunit
MAVVARRTGLNPDLVRAWERRHGAVEPARSRGNQRLYSDRDIERLVLIRRALDAGWQIGHVASLRDAQIRALIEGAGPGTSTPEHRAEPGEARPATALAGTTGAEFLRACLDDVARMEEAGLQRHLDAAAATLGRIAMIDHVLVPLFQRIGDEVAAGTLRIASEHLATAVAGRFIESLRAAYPPAEGAPSLVVTTPVFQHHHLGALLVAATGRMEGWRTTWLGPNLPAEEIAAAARARDAAAVALSITAVAKDPSLDAELGRLGSMLRDGPEIVVGGSAAREHQATLDAIGARRIDDLPALRAYLGAAL